MPFGVFGVLMASSRKRPLPDWKLPRGPRRHLPKRARALRTAWVLFILIGAPLGFIMYRKGRYTGYRSGAISERATARNRSEGRVSVANPALSRETPDTIPNPPPPPEMPPQIPMQ